MQTQIRPGGGFRDAFEGELEQPHTNSNAVQAAVSNKQQGQQGSVAGQQGAAKQLAALQQGAGQTPLAQPQESNPARPVASIPEELLIRPVKDAADVLASFFDINRLLHIEANNSPADKQRKQQIAANWQRLTADEQAEVQRQFQETMQKKQREEQEREEREEAATKAQAEQPITPPSSPKRGFQGLNAKKKASTIIQNSQMLDRSASGGQ